VGEVDQPGAGDLRVEHRAREVHRAAEADGEPGGGGQERRVGAEPAIAETGQLPLRRRPSLQAVGGTEPTNATDPATGPRTVDLTAEDDTQTLPRLDSLERKLKDLEQQFG
ncbi:hypothetical protein ACFCWQ_30270, partial [Streptomyces sp. NPDC056401]